MNLFYDFSIKNTIILNFYDVYLDFFLNLFEFSQSSQSALFSSYIFIFLSKTCSNIIFFLSKLFNLHIFINFFIYIYIYIYIYFNYFRK